jgi:pyrophosphate--fructose-6-phosphate 1-phosphotransferase
VEATIGFDTACHGYAQLIGNTATDAASARKYYHFLRVMGTEPSQITLEVALRTHPNVVVLGEEVEHKREGLMDLVREVANLVVRRAIAKKNFGIVVIPEGLASAIPELKALTDELCTIFREKAAAGSGTLTEKVLLENLSPWGKAILESLPPYFQHQLMLEQTNAAVQLSQIETERLMAELVEKELDRRTKEGTFKGKFSAVTSFLGYQARGAAPSNFDCDLAYTLGVSAAFLARFSDITSYLVVATGLKNPTENWHVGAIPLTSLLVADVSRTPYVPVGKVALSGPAHQALRTGTEKWEVEESYINPGPCQFAGPTSEERPMTLVIQDDPGYLQRLSLLNQQFHALREACRPGCSSAMLGIATQSLRTLTDIATLLGGNASS